VSPSEWNGWATTFSWAGRAIGKIAFTSVGGLATDFTPTLGMGGAPRRAEEESAVSNLLQRVEDLDYANSDAIRLAKQRQRVRQRGETLDGEVRPAVPLARLSFVF
jgi:hypothetical protein